MPTFSKGKFARAMCDRCGHEMKYLELKREWTGLLVCGECWDPQTKIEFPTNFPTDPEALREPRPDNDVEAHEGRVYAGSEIGGYFTGQKLSVALGEITVTLI